MDQLLNLTVSFLDLGPLKDIAEEASKAVADTFFLQFAKSGQWMMTQAFSLADSMGSLKISFEDQQGMTKVWQMARWVGGMLVVLMFFLSVAVNVAQARPLGILHSVGGLIKYILVVAASVGVVGMLSEMSDVATRGILQYGLDVTTFNKAGGEFNIMDPAVTGTADAALFIFGFFAMIFSLLLSVEFMVLKLAVMGFLCLMVIVSAGFVFEGLDVWWRRVMRWTLVALAVKPVMAGLMVLVIAFLSDAKGYPMLVGAIALLMVLILLPIVLLKTFDSLTGGVISSAGSKALGVISGGAAGAAITSSNGGPPPPPPPPGGGDSAPQEFATSGWDSLMEQRSGSSPGGSDTGSGWEQVNPTGNPAHGADSGDFGASSSEPGSQPLEPAMATVGAPSNGAADEPSQFDSSSVKIPVEYHSDGGPEISEPHPIEVPVRAVSIPTPSTSIKFSSE